MISLLTKEYKFIGTDNGRVLQCTQNGDFLARLFSFRFIATNSSLLKKKNKVYALAHFDTLIAASGYGGEIILQDYLKRNEKKTIYHSKVTVSALCFINATTLVSANYDGEVFISHTKKTFFKKFITTKTDIHKLLYIAHLQIVLVASKDNYLTMIDIQDGKIDHKFLFFTHGIVKDIRLCQQELHILFTNNKKLSISFTTLEKKLQEFHDDFQQKLNSGYITKRYTKESLLYTNTQTLTIPQEFFDAYEKNNFTLCYELIDRYSLADHEIVTLLEKHYRYKIKECEEFAQYGDAKKLIQTLNNLLMIQTRLAKTGDLLRLSFLKQITLFEEKASYDKTQNLIYSYIDLFGYDLEIAKAIHHFEQKSNISIAIFSHQQDRVSRTLWCSYFHHTH